MNKPDVSAPLVTVITPTYNHEGFIGRCIESLIQQTYPNWEQVIIDDGSTDATAAVISGYLDPRIRYFYQENKGIALLASTYNRALRLGKGDFIAILEGDDLWPPDKLSSLIPNLVDEDVVLGYGAVAEISADGTWNGRIGRAVRRRRNLDHSILLNSPIRSSTPYMLRADGADLIPPSTVVIRRSALEAVGGFQYFPNLFVTDFPTFINLSLLGKFYYTPRVMGYRRRHLRSATFQNQTDISRAVRHYQEKFEKEHAIKLSNTDRSVIRRSWHASDCDAAFSAGRICLLERRWKKARSHFERSFAPSLPRLFLASAAGWILSWVHCDLEFVFRTFGIATLTESGPNANPPLES